MAPPRRPIHPPDPSQVLDTLNRDADDSGQIRIVGQGAHFAAQFGVIEDQAEQHNYEPRLVGTTQRKRFVTVSHSV
jgi:hypothetical protein